LRIKWALACTAMAWAPPVAAQTADSSKEADDGDIVVVGSRAAPRLVTDSAVPVDVLSQEALSARGDSDLSKILTSLSPSFNFPRTSSGPSVAGARPATLRGLNPDQTLVLVNGHRRHASSIIQFNNGGFRGSVPVDYNLIPVSAIGRVEILRDGAAAQYGSDAIAGVVNIVLDDSTGTAAHVQYGQTDRGDGETVIIAGCQGIALGPDGFLVVTGEFRDRAKTDAAEIDPRFGRKTSEFGDPDSTDINLVINTELRVASDVALYGFFTGAHRVARSSPLFRAPTVAPTFYPNGFLPVIRLELWDIGATAGVRGELGGWKWDLSNSYGRSQGDYDVSNSVNTSLGAASPTEFYGGGARYTQDLVNLSVDRRFDLLAGANLAAGVEYRWEGYRLVSGDAASYFRAGAQGFPGFNPPSPVDFSRDSYSIYLDGVISPIEGLDIGLAGRYESYSDFGDKATGKVSIFFRPIDVLAFRANVNTGFRAPSLHQQFFSTVTSQLNAGVLQNVGTFAVSDPVAVALGSSPLRAESSTSLSGGVVLTPGGGLTFTIDAYRIDIDDRIALSENLQGATVEAILRANGVTNAAVARFFTNAADTRNYGVEAALRWSGRLAERVDLAVMVGYAAFDGEVRSQRVNPVLPNVPLLGAQSIDLVLAGQPHDKAILNTTLRWDALTINADLTVFGDHRITNPLGGGNREAQGQTSLDLSLSYRLNPAFTLSAGVLNLTDAYPERIAGEMTGRPFSEVDPLGVNGREYFVRLGARF
jgi:iron complex outermembrane receptor protein